MKQLQSTVLFDAYGLDAIKYKESIKKCGFSEKELINYKDKKSNLEELYSKIKTDIIRKSCYERTILIRYLNQENFLNYNNVGIVDIGWRGSLQYALKNVLNMQKCNVKISGYYLGLNNKSKQFIQDGLDAKGYLFSPYNNKLENYIMGCLGLIESFFTAPHGSTIGYKVYNNKISYILDDYEYGKDDIAVLNDIQNGALNFIKDFSNFNKNINILISYMQASKRIIWTLINPTYKNTIKFGNIMFSDNGINYIAKPMNKYYYLKNPKKLNKDFINSTWKIGFMKRFFRINLPYAQIYSITKKLINNK